MPPKEVSIKFTPISIDAMAFAIAGPRLLWSWNPKLLNLQYFYLLTAAGNTARSEA
jgi:hypothetical protein